MIAGLFSPLLYSSCNRLTRLANATKRLVYASSNRLMAGNNKAGVLKVSSMPKSITAFSKSGKNIYEQTSTQLLDFCCTVYPEQNAAHFCTSRRITFIFLNRCQPEILDGLF